MKVLFLTNNYPSDLDRTSGIMVWELAHAMRQLDVDLRVVHLDERLAWPFTMLRRYRFDRVRSTSYQDDPDWLLRYRVRAWPRALGVALRARGWIGGLAARLAKTWPDFRPDLIHSRTFIPCGVVADGLADRWKRPLLVSTHGGDTAIAIRRPLSRRAILKLSSKPITVVCVSEAIRATLLEHGVDQRKVTIIYNGMDTSKVHVGPNPLAEKYRGKRLVVGIGHLIASKGFDLLIEAVGGLAGSYPDLRCAIVGGGREGLRLRNLIARLALENVVGMVGAKAGNEAMAYIDACEVFCLPSWSEGFGIVYLEAMAHGKPVIAVQGQGVANVVADNGTGLLVPPRDAPAVAGAIRKLLDDPGQARRMGDRGRKLVQEQLNWRNCAMNYLELYRQVAEGSKL